MREARLHELDRVAALWTAITEHHRALDPLFRQRRGAPADDALHELLAALSRDGDAAILVFESFGSASAPVPAPAGRDLAPPPPGGAGAASGGAADPADLCALCIVRIDRAPPILEETARAEITDIGVREDARRHGIATQLLDAALAWVRTAGVSRVEVQVAVGNREGQAFWRARGFGDLMDVLHKRL